MFENVAILVVILTGMGLIAWLLNTIIRNRHASRMQKPESLGAIREVQLLANENAGLKGQMGRLEERLATLERIVTDPAERTAREIEQLRQQ